MCVHISRGVHMVCVCVCVCMVRMNFVKCVSVHACVCAVIHKQINNAATCFIIPRLFSISSLNARNHCAVDG